MRLFQYLDQASIRRVGVTLPDSPVAQEIRDCHSVRELALESHRLGRSLRDSVEAHGIGEPLDLPALLETSRVLLPLDHPDPAHGVVAITGLTHHASAVSRAAMHAAERPDETDTIRMFRKGMLGGRPPSGTVGAQPEWAYKGDGSWPVAPGAPLVLPSYGCHGGEEAEVAALYVIADDGTVLRVGYALGNEFSDHVMEKENYLYLGHSKLRQCSYGPELFVGDLPGHVDGRVSILREDEPIWSAMWTSGADNMCHSLENLEYHHFKYIGFRRPGDIHVYFLGASALSFGEGMAPRAGDEFVISAPQFGQPLRNRLVADTAVSKPAVKPL